jgi:small subunit ribosomal protein S4
MGDPKKRRKKYSLPFQKWEKSRIDNELELIREYGLKNKREIRKAESKLQNYKRQAKKLVAAKSKQAEKERKQLLDRLKSLRLLDANASMDNILDLEIKDILERRLQTILFKKTLAKSVKAARQLIVHGHILVNNTKVTVPSYLVSIQEQDKIDFSPNSAFFSEEHPERSINQTPKKPVKKEDKK